MEGAPLEGEWDILEDDKQSSSHSYPKATVEEITDVDAPNAPHNHPGDGMDTLDRSLTPREVCKKTIKLHTMTSRGRRGDECETE